MLPALSVALGTACTGAASFGDAPNAAQLFFLLAAVLFASASYLLDLDGVAVAPILKKSFDLVTLQRSCDT